MIGPRWLSAPASRPVQLMVALMALATAPSCSNGEPRPAALDEAKVASIIVGQSSRSDVFTILGRPSHMERSARGETWIYEAKEGGGAGRLVSGAAAASGVIGAFVPYAGLLGSGLGLADAATGGARPEATTASLAVSFGDEGIVRDCVYATTEFSSAPGRAPGIPKLIDCRRAPGSQPPPSAAAR